MTLLDRLREVGSRLRIFEAHPAAAPSQAAQVKTRTLTLDELTTEISSEEVRALAELPAELSVAFEKIYEAAGIGPPAHGWDADRLAEVVGTNEVRNQERTSAQKALLERLAADRVSVEDLVREVIARDQALDAYEKFVRSKMDDRIAARERKIADLERQAAALAEECGRLKVEGKADQERWREWRARKRSVERALADSIGYLIDRPVVTIDNDE